MSDFYDEEEVRAVYHTELENLVKEVTGARKVVVFDTTLRTDDPAPREHRSTQLRLLLAHIPDKRDAVDGSPSQRAGAIPC